MSDLTSTAAWTTRDELTITELIERRLETDPHGELFDVMGKSWSAAQLVTEADRVAGALRAYGVGPGDRVASLCENSSEQLVTIFAALRLGAISVPVNTAFKGDYLRHQLRDSGTKLLVIDELFAERAAYVAGDLPDLGHVVVVGALDGIERGDAGDHPTEWHDWLDVSTHEPIAEPHVAKPADLAVFIYTGGTTGLSKGCMINQNYAVTLAHQIATMWGRTPDDVVWTPLPMFHFNAVTVVLIGTLLVGGRASIYRRFSVSNFWPEINRTGATMASTLGSMVALLADDPDRPEMPRSGAPEANTTLRFISGVPITPALRERCIERFGISPHDAGYGATEGSLLTWMPPGQPNKPGAAGIVNDEFWDVRIFDDDDNEVPPETKGEIVGRPKKANVMFDGYWGRPDATLECMRNLWFHTGDLGRFDEDGFLYFMDRKADYLRRRGENVSAHELEAVYARHPAIAEVAIHAVPSPLMEDDIKATVIVRAGMTLDAEELYRWSIDEVPYFALPRYIEFRDDLPRSDMGKVLKTELREDGVTDATWDAEASGITIEKR